MLLLLCVCVCVCVLGSFFLSSSSSGTGLDSLVTQNRTETGRKPDGPSGFPNVGLGFDGAFFDWLLERKLILVL